MTGEDQQIAIVWGASLHPLPMGRGRCASGKFDDALSLEPGYPTGGAARAHPGREQNLAGVDVADTATIR